MSASENRYRDDSPAAEHPRSRLAILGFGLAVLAAVAAMLAGWGSRFGVWEFRTGFTVLKWAVYLGIAAAAVSLGGVVATRVGVHRRGIGFALAGLAIGLAVVYVPWNWRRTARSVPPIHDITTDTQDPPPFVVILPLRADAPNSAEYEGDSIAGLQREAYPDVQPLALDLPPDRAFDAALESARGMGWEIHAAEPAEGRIEATDTTFWFGFEDDVVVRVTPAAGGARVDVRSVSRVGGSDVGTNAKRIREYLDAVRERAAE
ncbi:MAG TPA: DUF1499 domain-containing protein [Gemmatimonadota bacterium]|nr:DUF1499 domain-containing protein [Gemmatimonadota bacterium]